MWLSVDPLADRYPNLTPYAMVANNPVMLIDPNGKEIEEVVNDDGSTTVRITGKIINFSSKDVDLNKALGSIKDMFENQYSGEDEEGNQINFEFDFEVAENMDDVEIDDHLIVLADKKGFFSDKSGAANGYGGMVATVAAEYFSGFYDNSIGEEGERTASHEIGHLLGLEHYRNPFNMMSQGRAEFRGNKISRSQRSSIMDNIHSSGKVNLGSNANWQGLPLIGPSARSFFDLRKTYGREKSRR